MALNINWQGPQAHNLDVNTAMQGNREMFSKAGQGIGTFIKNYRKYKADQEMKGLIDEYKTGRGTREKRMQEILAEIKQLEVENAKIREEYDGMGAQGAGEAVGMTFNWRQ